MPLWPFTFLRGGSIQSSSSLELCSVKTWKQLSGLDRLRGGKGAVLCLIISHWDFFFSFPLLPIFISVVYFASLCTVMTRLIHFCCLFFHKWTASGRVEMIWLKGLLGQCGWLLGCPGWSPGSCQVVDWVRGCDAPSNQCHFGIVMRKRPHFCMEGLWRATHLQLILYFDWLVPMIPPLMRWLECLWDPESSFPH